MIYFDPTPANFSTMLVVCLGVWAIQSASKMRADVNVPLVFYSVLLIFNRVLDRGMYIPLILLGVALAALIRFEFLNKWFTKWVSYLEIAVLVMILWNALQTVFGPQLALRV